MSICQHLKIFTAFTFLRLRSPDIVWYQWVYPTIFVAFGGLFYFTIGRNILVFNFESLIAEANTLMGILVGFYIAALAAVSSFSSQFLDEIMKGRAPTLSVLRQRVEIKETLTRRRFLSILFGYCATVAIFLYILGVLQANLAVSSSAPAWLLDWSFIISYAFWLVYGWFLSSLLIVTLLGLHYLVDRMHRA
jgi:hypothetical protein